MTVKTSESEGNEILILQNARDVIPIIFRNFAQNKFHTLIFMARYSEKLESVRRGFGKHKYLIVCVLFFVNLLFIDHNSMLKRYEHHKEIASLRAERERYKRLYEHDMAQLHSLETDPQIIEKIARERYFMKRPDEDVFVFEYEGNDNDINETTE